MIAYTTIRRPILSIIERLKIKDWQKSMENISDAEIISIDPNPYNKEVSNDTSVTKVENNGSNN